MAAFDPAHASLDYNSLKESVVVFTGGSLGIGAATVRSFYERGARIVFGDLASTEEQARALIQATSSDRVHFLPTDVRNYQDNLALFKFALEKYGRVDHAIANAGARERPGWFDPQAGIEGVETEPDLTTLDVCLKGPLFFAHIACAYLVHDLKGQDASQKRNKSLTLLSSIAGWKESPGLFVYSAGKHGVLGLMRGLRIFAPGAYPNVRVNAVCPSMTMTRMVEGIKDGWMNEGLPTNTPEDLARVVVGICAAGPGSSAISSSEKTEAGGMDWTDAKGRGMNGRALHVMGGTAVDFEQGLDQTQSLWLGSEMSEWVEAGQRSLSDGAHWIKR